MKKKNVYLIAAAEIFVFLVSSFCILFINSSTGFAVLPSESDLAITFDKTVYLARNVEKTISLRIDNNGEETLNNVVLELENLDSSFYTVTPSKINSLNAGETKILEVRLFIEDVFGDKKINYSLKTDEITKKESGVITVLGISDYLYQEIKLFDERIKTAKGKVTEDKLISKIEDCERRVKEIKSQVEGGEFISAIDNLDATNDCISSVENPVEGWKISGLFSWIKMEYILWLGLSVFSLGMMALIALLIKKASKTLRIPNFPKNKSQESNTRAISGKYFEDKIKKIKKRL